MSDAQLTDNKEVQAVIFDFDGVVVDTEGLHAQALAAVAKADGVEVHEHDVVGGVDPHILIEAYKSRGLDLPEGKLAKLLEEKTKLQLQYIADGEYVPYSGAVELMREAAKHSKVAVCTSSASPEVLAALEKLGLGGEVVSVVVSRDDVTRYKPDPMPYLTVVDQLGVDVSACVVLEDSAAGTTAAKAAGLKVIAIGQTTPKEKLACADHYVDGIGEITLEMIASVRAGVEVPA